jgi:hypothetical protein
MNVGIVCAVFLWASVWARDAQPSGRSQPGAAKPVKVYAESPAAWYEAAFNAAQISSDGKWALYHHSFGRGIKLINLETGREDAGRLAAGMDRVFNAAFCTGSRLARLGDLAGQRGWYLPGPDGLRQLSLPSNAIPRWSPDGSAVAYFRREQAGQGLFVGNEQGEKQYSMKGPSPVLSGRLTAVWSTLWRGTKTV